MSKQFLDGLERKLILGRILPHYRQEPAVSPELNLEHVRYLACAIKRICGSVERQHICKVISKTSLLLAKSKKDSAAIWTEPACIYLPHALTGNDDLEMFFNAKETAQFLSAGYNSIAYNNIDLHTFLLQIGCADLPRLSPTPNSAQTRTVKCRDWLLDGLSEALANVEHLPTKEAQTLSGAIWRLLIRLLREQANFWLVEKAEFGPNGGRHNAKMVDAAFLDQLKKTPWLFAQDGKRYPASALFLDKRRAKSDSEVLLAELLEMDGGLSLIDEIAQPSDKPKRDEVAAAIEALYEGGAKEVVLTTWERNLNARKLCIEHYGWACTICGFDFGKVYGTVGKDYIQVHHLTKLSDTRVKHGVDPVRDLRPVCPNCHAMIHRTPETVRVEELRKILVARRIERSRPVVKLQTPFK